MTTLLDRLAERLGRETMHRFARSMECDESTARIAAASLTVALFGVLRKTLTSDVAARELHDSLRAAEGDFSGSSADDLMREMRRPIESTLAGSLHLSSEALHRLSAMLVPALLEVLAARASEEELGADGLADRIVHDERELWQKEPRALHSLEKILDGAAGPGEIVDRGIGALE